MPRNTLSCLFLAAIMLGLAACDAFPRTTPPDPPAPSQTRVVRLTLDPDTVAFGDTVLTHVVIEDSLDTRFRYEWGSDRSQLVPVDGQLNGPRVRFIPPRLRADSGEVRNITSSVWITNDVPGTRSVTYSFSIPVQH